MKRPKSRLVIAVAAVVVIVLGGFAGYVASYCSCDFVQAPGGGCCVLVTSGWQATIYAPAAWVESRLRGEPVEILVQH